MQVRVVTALTLWLGATALGQNPEPISVHQMALEAHADTPTSPDLIGEPGPIIPLQPRTHLRSTGPCKTVYGFLPYWESSANIRWDHLTHLAAFSVEVNANGTLGNDRGWPWTSVINTAHANGVKVVLCATNFTPSELLTLMTTPAYKNAFFVNIKNKMLEGTTDGINIDFEGTGEWRQHAHQFMADLTAYMHSEVPGCEVTFCGPAVNWSSAFNMPALAAACDGIFIMGYAFAGGWSSTSGPNAPLTGGSINITNTILTQYGAVTQTMPEKLILGLPYYGHHWETSSSAARSSVIDFISSTRFYQDEPNSQIYGRLWDATSQTPWYRWHDGANWNQVWYDDAESLGLKYQLATDHDLQGVGMWALNYDRTRPELWDELSAHFIEPCCEQDAIDTNGFVAYADDFDAGTSALNWDLYTSSSDYTADFAFDYSVHGIPPAPNSVGDTTIGLKFTVNNNDANPSLEAVSAFPVGQSFSGDYSLKFDMWMNYNGGPGGGVGSTEHASAGINHGAGRVIWGNNPSSDGHWFAVTGEGGATDDYLVQRGPLLLSVASGGYVALSRNSSASFYQTLFPSPTFESQGAPGKNWVEVEIRQTGDVIEWLMDSTVISSRIDPTYTSGNIMLGYMDLFTSIANPAAENYVIFDNVRVELAPDLDCNANGVPDGCEAIGGGDFNGDGLIDAADLEGFVDCLGLPDSLPLSPTCAAVCLLAFDADFDGDVDLVDYAALQGSVSP